MGYHFINLEPLEFVIGVAKITVAFFGHMFLPIVLADMLKPQEASQLCNRTIKEIVSIYVPVAIFTYLGFSTHGNQDMLKKLGVYYAGLTPFSSWIGDTVIGSMGKFAFAMIVQIRNICLVGLL